jgi:CBS domain containing-hemolysin-like protein
MLELSASAPLVGLPGPSLARAVRHIDTYLSACQLDITVCSIGLGITAEPVLTGALERVFGEGRGLGVAGATLAFVPAYYALVAMLDVVPREPAPKSLAISRTLVLRPFGVPLAGEAESDVHLAGVAGALARDGDSDLRDEFDPREAPEIERGADGLRGPGEAHLHQLRTQLKLDFGAHHAATLDVVERLGHVPAQRDELRLDGARLRLYGVRVLLVEIPREESE